MYVCIYMYVYIYINNNYISVKVHLAPSPRGYNMSIIDYIMPIIDIE